MEELRSPPPPRCRRLIQSCKFFPDIGSNSSGTVAIAWVEGPVNSESGRHVLVIRSQDSGQTWSSPKDIPVGGDQPRLAVTPAGDVFLVFISHVDPAPFGGGVDLVKWASGSASPDAPSFFSSLSSNWNVVIRSGTGSSLLMAYGAGGDCQTCGLYFAISTDGGATWTKDVKVANSPSQRQYIYPEVAMNASGIYFSWCDYDSGGTGTGSHLEFVTSVDGGTTWSGPTQVDQTGRAHKLSKWLRQHDERKHGSPSV